jgi:monofunctional biosynthetic peptidoglycan transglycosylase
VRPPVHYKEHHGRPAIHAPGAAGRWRFRPLLKWTGILVLAGPLVLILTFRFVPPPVTPLMLIRLVQGHTLRRDWVAYERIAPALAHSVIASEDNFFCEEALGFDIAALRGQVGAWEDGKRPRGASTITMQTAKNLLLWPGRDPVRKLLEAWLTPQIALLWPKRRVLEVYLNIVEFGPGIYGAEAAAQTFFRKSAAALTPREAAQLASVLPGPLVWAASPAGPYVRQRAAVIERRVEQIGPMLGCAE